MFYKVRNVIPLDNMLLQVEFENGIIKSYDVKKLKDRFKIFKDLENKALFELAKVDAGGYGIMWNEKIDLSCNEIWENGVIISRPNEDFKNKHA